MQKTLLIVVTLVLAFSIAGFAQYSNPSSTQNPSQSNPSQSNPSGQQPQQPGSMTGSTTEGEKTVVGCVIKNPSGTGYVLRTANGDTPLNKERDFSAYVGKQVRLQGTWEQTAVTDSSSKASSQSAPQAFGGELRVRIVGEVIGDCSDQAAPQK